MRKIQLHSSVFNDGEVVVQKGPSKSLFAAFSIAEEQENTEEITVKVPDVKPLPKASTLKGLGLGLGKCSRVVLKTGNQDLNSDSDNDKSSDCDVSTFVRPVPKVVPAVQKRTRSTVTSAVASEVKMQSASASESAAITCLNTDPVKPGGTGTRSKSFVMDKEMKSFDPAEWRRARMAQVMNVAQAAVKEVEVEQKVKVQVQLAAPVPMSLSVVPKSLPLSPIISRSGSKGDSSDDDEYDTSQLDLSVCETKVLVPRKILPASTSEQQSLPLSQSASKGTGGLGKGVQVDGQLIIKSSSNITPAVSTSTCPSSASASGVRSMHQSNENNNHEIPSAPCPKVLPVEQEDNPSGRRKRVSFAGNHGPDKRSKECHVEVSCPVITTKQVDTKAVTLHLKGKSYTRLSVLGKGGSSCVYRVMSQSDSQLYAYKRVEVKGSAEDNEAIFDSYVNEIELLERLKGTSPYIIDLVDAEVDREGMYIAIVMEAGEVDLAKVLSQKQKKIPSAQSSHPSSQPSSSSRNKGSGGGGDNENVGQSSAYSSLPYTAIPQSTSGAGSDGLENLNPFFTRMVWQEMLEAVDHIHNNRIVHGDLKPANFVFVKGHLKLIDFGIAKAFSNDTTNIYRESQIGTVNYMAPEAIAPYSVEPGEGDEHEGMNMRLGRASDIWSLGCILYQMIYGRPPFAALTTIQKLHAIPNTKYLIQYPQLEGQFVDWDAIGTIKACLERDPRKRAKIRGEGGLLSMPYLSVTAMRSSNSVVDPSSSSSSSSSIRNEILVTEEKVRCAVQRAVKSVQGQKGQESQLIDKVWRLIVETQVARTDLVDCTLQNRTVPTTASSVASSNPNSSIASKIKRNDSARGVNTVDSIGEKEKEMEVKVTSTAITRPAVIPVVAAIPIIENKENIPFVSSPPSQATRLRLANATAVAVAVSVTDKSRVTDLTSSGTTTASTSANTSAQKATSCAVSSRTDRHPLRVLPVSQQKKILSEQQTRENTVQDSNVQKGKWMRPSPDHTDKEESVIEKRIGAMRKFLDEEQEVTVTGTGTVDFMDGF